MKLNVSILLYLARRERGEHVCSTVNAQVSRTRDKQQQRAEVERVDDVKRVQQFVELSAK
jgi:hypothetical protein